MCLGIVGKLVYSERLAYWRRISCIGGAGAWIGSKAGAGQRQWKSSSGGVV